MLTVYVDVYMTRRKTMHHVMDAHDTLAFSSRRLIECLNYCWDQGEDRVLIHQDDAGASEGFQATITLEPKTVHLVGTQTSP